MSCPRFHSRYRQKDFILNIDKKIDIICKLMDIGLSIPSIQNHHLSREGNLATLEILATNFAFETYLREMLCLDMFTIDLILPTRSVNWVMDVLAVSSI